MIQIHIVTGDVDGIGLEISIKALLSIGLKKNVQFWLWRSPNSFSFLKHELNNLHSQFHISQIKHFSEEVDSKASLVEVLSSEPPTVWVQQAAQLCFNDPYSKALVTGPLSKIQLQKDGFSFKGHTDLLRKKFSIPDVYMCFLGEKFNVVLLTDHQSLSEVKITSSLLQNGLHQTLAFREKLFRNKNLKPIGLLGLNPHAGENGILGSEELKVFHPIIKRYTPHVVGPLVPDTAFQPSQWRQYSFYLCAYHDQGLIPFKMIHPQSGVHVTLGLPFVRTSVDHGTAKDIFGQNKASFLSMKKAIEKALNFLLI